VSRLAAALVSVARDAQFEILDALESEPALSADKIRAYKERLDKAYAKFLDRDFA
jgi:uncharacterized protein (UPF0254 family)